MIINGLLFSPFITLNGNLAENILFHNTFYLQPNLSNINDFRFLYDAELKLTLNANIAGAASLSIVLGLVTWMALFISRSISGQTIAVSG